MRLARLQWPRGQMDRRTDPRPWRTKPGIFKQWLRPELYRGIGSKTGLSA